jgi:threonine aldolase
MEFIDLRSDTVTQPTDAMRRAMAEAALGDDVFSEDPTVNELEALAADQLGKEAGLYVPSGTMANLVAVMTHAQKGDEVLLEAESHTFLNEAGGIAAVAGVFPRTITGKLGYIAPEQLRTTIRSPNVHYPPSRLLCLENTHNRAGGMPFGPDEMKAICTAAHELGLVVHLDGARIFNAAVALSVPAKAIVRECDSVMFCVSKGLSAPVGSVLVGSQTFIDRARRFRKMVGGGMRQAGVIAAAGVVALKTMVNRLAEDHANARRLAEGLAAVPGLSVDLTRVRTNMVLLEVGDPLGSAAEFATRMKREGVLAFDVGRQTIRLVTHRHITQDDISRALEAVRRAARQTVVS